MLDADWNNQTVTLAFFITCNSSGQEGSIVLTFSAPRNGAFTLHKKANANPSLGSAWQSNVSGAVFGIYNSYDAAQSGNINGLVKKITTNSLGETRGSFEDGTYWVKELSAPWPYIKTEQIISFEAKPKSKEQATLYNDSVPPIQIRKFILPSADSYTESDIMNGSKAIAHITTAMAPDGRTVKTEILANEDIPSLSVTNSATSILTNPLSTNQHFDVEAGRFTNLKAGDSATLTQDVKPGAGWSNTSRLATICSISIGSSRMDMALKLHASSLEGTRYGIYADNTCTNKIGEAMLDVNGIGYYGKKKNEWLSSNTTYYVQEIAGANGYTASNDIYPVSTARNSQVTVNVADSFATLILTKESGAGRALTEKMPQFSLKGAKYGVFNNRDHAELHDESKVINTLDGRPAVIETDKFGNATEVALGTGTYYVSELPSSITMPYEWGHTNDDFSEPVDINDEISKHDFSAKSNGKFLLDESVYVITLKPGGTVFMTSSENIPVKIQLQKQSSRADLVGLPQFSLEGAIFGVYETEEAAKAAPAGNYQEDGFFLSSEGAVAFLYGNEDGMTTPSWELPLRDYYIKEIRAPKNYKLLGKSEWVLGSKHISDQILHISVDDFISSGRYIDGVLSNTTLVKSNEPEDVSVQVQKQANEVPDGMKTPGNAMSLAGARFAIYKSFEDARDDKNRLLFNTDDQEINAAKTDLLTSRDDGWTNKAIGLPAEECYWVREIEPPHVLSDDVEQNTRNVAESMYVLDTEPVKATFEVPDSVAMVAHKNDVVKPVSITIGKYAMSMDSQGRNLHVGEKDSNDVPYNDAYTGSAFEGALFGLFETKEQAEAAPATDDANDVSVEQAAYDSGAIRVLRSDANGICGTADNLAWKSDGYYIKELKAPTSGCYQRNESVLQIGCDKNTEDSQHIWISIDKDKISKHFEIDEVPNYYYVKIEKTSSDPSVLSDSNNYTLEGIHFGLYKTQEEAEAATFENPGRPLYNLYTKKVEHDDGTTHYEAISGLTGPGIFWAKELVDPSDRPNGFQALSTPIKVEAKRGGIPKYDATPIVPENSAPIVNPVTGQLQYKTAKDIDAELGITMKSITNKAHAALGCLNVPNGGLIATTMISKATLTQVSATDYVDRYGISTQFNGVSFNVTRKYYPRFDPSLTITTRTYTTDIRLPSEVNSYKISSDLSEITFFRYCTISDMTFVGTYDRLTFELQQGDYRQESITIKPIIPTGYKITEYYTDVQYPEAYNGAHHIKKMIANNEEQFNIAYDHSLSIVGFTLAPDTHTVSFNANGGTGASVAKTVSYGTDMPAVTKPTRAGYIFQGYYDAVSGGTQYYKSDGTSARHWDKSSNATLYAHWMPITYKVQYTATDPNASLVPGMTGTSTTTNETYDKEGALKSGIYHKFGYVSNTWKYTADDGTIKILTPGTSKLLNLTTVNGKTVVLTAVWNLNEYYVTFHDGLSTRWGPAPVIETGINPDSGTPWSIGYQQKLYYDDYSTDGIASDALTRVRYSHPHFAFKYWLDSEGNKYDDMQEVKNLTAPNKVKELTGYWYPSFDYGVDCESNIIQNQPVGGITVQKTVKTSGIEPLALTDLSGIEFALFDDASCEHLVLTSFTDSKGIATFSSVESNKTYYVKEKSIPERLSKIMQTKDSVLEVRSGNDTSYKFENESKQLSLTITKSPSQKAISSVPREILNNIPPVGATFAVYATEQDARNDINRIEFYNENGHIVDTATVSRTVDIDGVKCTQTTLSGLPNQNLWVAELVAADFGKHEYIRSKEPVFVDKEQAEVSDNNIAAFLTLSNDMSLCPHFEASKEINELDLSRVPKALHDDAKSLLDGITYALYTDIDAASTRSDDYALLVNVNNSTAVFSDLPAGTYYLIEWSLPQQAQNSGISRSDKVIPIEVSDDSASASTEMFDSLITKKMYIQKVDAETSEPIQGVVFDIYSSESKEELLCSTAASDAQGLAVSDMDLIPGRSYFVQERYDSMPDDYNGHGVGHDTSWSGWIELTLSDNAESAFVVENTKNDDKGSIEVKKASNTGAGVSNAVFAVYDSTGMLYQEMVTDATGNARINDVPVGNYTVQEVTAPFLHALTSNGADAPVFEGTVFPNETWNVNEGLPVLNYQGYVKVHKESSLPEITDAMPDTYSLTGAVYSLYPIEDGNPAATPISVTLITDENGECLPVAVPLGAYKVVETTEPSNFSTPDEQKEFYIEITLDNATSEDAYVIESKDVPLTEPLANFLVEKRSSETYESSDGSPQGATSMENTKFAIEYTPKQAVSYADAIASEKIRKWVIATDADGRATFDEDSIITEESDELYHDAHGTAALPVGTIVVKEIVPPTGYALGEAPLTAYRFNGISGKFEELFDNTDDIKEWNGNPTFTATNSIYRADISFHKVDAYDKDKHMSNIPFVLTLLDENGEAIERHLIVTDSAGNFSSKTGSLVPVNDNDRWFPGDITNGCVDSSFAPTDSRVWFSGSRVDVVPSNDKGALIYGDYELREYHKNDTQHYQSLEPIFFSVRGDNDVSWIEIDGRKINDGNLTDAIGDIENHSAHIISTELLDAVSNTHIMGSDSLLATESVSFTDVTVGEKYIFETYAFDMDTKEPIMKTFEDVDGTIVDVQAGGTYTLNATNSSGTIFIDVSFEGYDVTGRKIGLVTKVYHDGYLSDEHNADLSDNAESVSFARISTMATDSDTEQHIGFSDGHINVTDTVKYENLVPGYEYAINGVLMDKSSGAALKDEHGNKIESQTVFTPTSRNGQIEVEFSFDMLSNKGFNAVVFEEIHTMGTIVAEHKDINDANQNVSYPEMRTHAMDKETGAFQGNAEGSQIHITDTVTYENLIGGIPYELRGFLYTLDTAGNKELVEGAFKSIEFIPENPNGTITLTFESDSSSAYGHRVLVGEEIWSSGKIIARHDDVSFTDQILSYPNISTTATDVISGLHIGNGERIRQLVDTVHIEGLKDGENYRIDGHVMGRSANGDIIETDISASEVFTSTSSVEDHKLIFDLPADFPADNAVVFEYLSTADGLHLLSKHDDAFDENQTVHYPKIGTLALHPDGGTHVGSNIDNKIVDTVFYENLVVGHEYIVTGMLVDKESGEFINVPDGSIPITSTTAFIPNAPTGTIDVSFDVNGIDTHGKTLVVFEQLFVKNGGISNDSQTLIATHCDIDDDKQSIFYPSLSTTARDNATTIHVGSSLQDAVIIDKIDYNNLITGYEYEIMGTLMDKSEGKPLVVDGSPVTSSITFMPENSNGTVEITFPTLDADSVKDKNIVVFEKLSLGGIEMAAHEDINDANQSVSYPVIVTSAKDATTELHEGNAERSENDKAVVVDTIEYSNIVAHEKYKIDGKLINKATGAPIAFAETIFTPEEANGSVEVMFEIDAEIAQGNIFVAFEKLFDQHGNEIAHHEEINDENQTIAYPTIKTKAKDAKTQTQVGSIENIDIIDTVSYEGLLPGHRYTIFGTLIDQASGKPVFDVNEDIVSGRTTFTADEDGTGEAEVGFISEIPQEMLVGKTFVAFERLEEADDDDHRVLAVHEDMDDEDQSIHYPVITKTFAHADNGSKVLPRSDKACISDVITYENLIPGIEYTIDGAIMNKDTKDVLVANGNAIIERIKFTPKTSTGEFTMVFDLDTTTNGIGEVVAFETISINNATTAEHVDISSEDQSIHGTESELVETGSITQMGVNVWKLLVISGCILISLVGIASVKLHRKYNI